MTTLLKPGIRAGLVLGFLVSSCTSSTICDSCVPSAELLLRVLPDPARVQASATGPACDGEKPRVVKDQLAVTIRAAGVCHIDATFPDGQQHTFDYQVEDHRNDECCHAFVVIGDGPYFCARTADAGQDNHGCNRF